MIIPGVSLKLKVLNPESSIQDVLIVGAGLSGLKIARYLQAAGRRHLRVLDKGRGVGGRAATRRWDDVPVDHGAQFFTVRSPEFRAQTNRWMAHGVCFQWAEGFHQWDAEHGLRAPEPGGEDEKHSRYACREGMSALSKDLAGVLAPGTVRLNSRVVRLRRDRDDRGQLYWEAELEGAPADAPRPAAYKLVLTLPTPQTLALLEASGLHDALDQDELAKLRAVEYAPTLAVLVRGSAPKTPWQGIQLKDATVTWIGADTDKRPGGVPAEGGEQVFVLHGSPDFSREWQDRDLDEAARRIVAHAGEIVGDWITRLPDRQVHRWRFANVPKGVEPWAGLQLAQEGEPPLYVAGDTFLHAKIEGAYRSGEEVAKAILARG